MTLEIVTIPCLQDNYSFLLHNSETGATAVVDVPDETPIEIELMKRGWRLTEILITHHHPDHIDGIDALRDATDARVIGAAADANRLPRLDVEVGEGDHVWIGAADGKVIAVPGHTTGHLAYYFATSEAVFTADSLMALGCGRLFEGTAEQMWSSLSKLAALPPETSVYSGHEYTESNAKFASTIEPANSKLISRIEGIKATRANGHPTIPSILSEELATNPFLRANQPEVKAALGMLDATDAEVFAEIRHRKDIF